MPRVQPSAVGGRDGEIGAGAEGQGGGALVLAEPGRTSAQEQSPQEGPIVVVDTDAPWAQWPMPAEVRMDAVATRMAAVPNVDAHGSRLALVGPDGLVGFPTRSAIDDLSKQITFPTDWVLSKLPVELQADVINARFAEVSDGKSRLTATTQPLQVNTDAGLVIVPGASAVTNIAPGWRDVLPHSWVAQKALDLMRRVYQTGGVAVTSARLTDAGCEVRFKTTYSHEVRPGGRSVGDVLSLGIVVTHRYGTLLSVALYVERLACLNGMTATRNEFEWKAAIGADQRGQLDWLGQGITAAAASFESMVQRARDMASTPLGDNPERAVVERARAMGVPAAQIPRVLSAYRMEEDPTEWGALNAMTRYATHDESVSDQRRRRLWETAGNWVGSFDMVSARLPRPLAVAVGASIFNDGE